MFTYLFSIYVFLLPNLLFLIPYFDHDAFMHHALHVLDAPGHNHVYNMWLTLKTF